MNRSKLGQERLVTAVAGSLDGSVVAAVAVVQSYPERQRSTGAAAAAAVARTMSARQKEPPGAEEAS